MVTLIDAREAAVLTGYHRVYLWTLMRNGDFPTAIHVPGGGVRPRVHFRKHEVEAWVADRAAKKAALRRAQA